MRSNRRQSCALSRSGQRAERRAGFSKVELLVAALVCGLLLVHVERALLASRERSRRQTCADHLRQLHLGLMSYHDSFRTLPPAGIWRARPEDELATLHISDDPAAISHQNWLQLLLPHIGRQRLTDRGDPMKPVGAPENKALRTSPLELATCPSDQLQTIDNRYVSHSPAFGEITFARGNYAINGGTQRMAPVPGTSADPAPGGIHLEIDPATRDVSYWGNGVAGFNRGFALEEFTNGQATLVAFDEVRAGIHPRDPRGVWALGLIGSSVTWAHGMNGDAGRPNADSPRADDLAGCVELHAALGPDQLAELGMPCCAYCLHSEQAAARSGHRGGVHALTLDGAAHFVANDIDPGLWHVLHSRETPSDVLQEWSDDAYDPRRSGLHRLEADAAAWADPAPGQISLTNSIGMTFVRLPPGRFVMGLPDEEINAVFDNDGSAVPHEVELTRPVWMAVYEVTRSEFDAVIQTDSADGNPPAQSEPRLPVSNVSWDDAAEFCERLSALPDEAAAGRRYRLPTEAEWEYACRAGRREPHVYVPERQPGDASGENAMKSPPLPIVAAGSYAPNEFGMFDMRGNVWEWCSDWSHPDYYAKSPQHDPQGPDRGYLKVVRGSDWLYAGQRCRLGFRATEPWLRSPFIGFRIVCESSSESL